MTVITRLANMIRRGEVILWTGAGFNRKAGLPSGAELAAKIIEECSTEEKEILQPLKGSLPDVAEEFVQMRAGAHDLMKILRRELKKSSPDLSLHQKVKDLIQISDIITTNYDSLFEDAFGDELAAIYTDIELPLSANAPRRLYKVHGDLSSPQTIVVARSHYTRFLDSMDDSVLWTHIRALMASRSVLFLGYSLADQDVRFTFESILLRLQPFQREHFLVVPGVPEYKRAHLTGLKVQVIDATAEEILGQLERLVLPHLLSDCQAGLVPLEQATALLQSKGVAATWIVDEFGKRLLRTVGSSDDSFHGRISLELTEEMKKRFAEYVADPTEEQFQIPAADVIKFESRVADFLLPPDGSAGNIQLTLKKLPNTEFPGVLYLQGLEATAVDVQAKGYTSSSGYHFRLEHSIFSLTLSGRHGEKGGEISYSITGESDPAKGRVVTKLLLAWLSGKKLLFSIPEMGVVTPMPVRPNRHNSLAGLRSHLEWLDSLYSDVLELSSHHRVYMRVPSKVTEEDGHALQHALGAINGKRWRVSTLSAHVVLRDGSSAQQFLNWEQRAFRFEAGKPESAVVFGQSLQLGILVGETTDAVVVNADEIGQAVNDGRTEFDVVFASKSDQLFVHYEPKEPKRTRKTGRPPSGQVSP